jgi:hypothetical protein
MRLSPGRAESDHFFGGQVEAHAGDDQVAVGLEELKPAVVVDGASPPAASDSDQTDALCRPARPLIERGLACRFVIGHLRCSQRRPTCYTSLSIAKHHNYAAILCLSSSASVS